MSRGGGPTLAVASRGQTRLRLGVIGLGRLWEARHKPALARMADRFRVAAVYDQVARRAEIEANQLGCDAVDGLAELAERTDVDALYLLTPQWFGIHPVALAASVGKPIYCAPPLASEPESLDQLARLLAAGGTPFMPELARRSYPATLRLRELLSSRIGRPRLILGHARLAAFDRNDRPGPGIQIAPAPLDVDPGGFLADWCQFLFEAEPIGLQAFAARTDLGDPEDGPDFEGFVAEFPGGGLAQIGSSRDLAPAWGETGNYVPVPGFHILAERGAAWVEMPDRLRWTDSEGTHEPLIPAEPTVGETLNAQFDRVARGEPGEGPGWAEALGVARLVADLRTSRREGRKVVPATA